MTKISRCRPKTRRGQQAWDRIVSAAIRARRDPAHTTIYGQTALSRRLGFPCISKTWLARAKAFRPSPPYDEFKMPARDSARSARHAAQTATFALAYGFTQCPTKQLL